MDAAADGVHKPAAPDDSHAADRQVKLVEKQGDKEVVVDESKEPAQTCTEEQRKKVKEMITAYVAASPPPRTAAAAPPAAAPAARPAHAGAPASTGSTTPVTKSAAEAKK